VNIIINLGLTLRHVAIKTVPRAYAVELGITVSIISVYLLLIVGGVGTTTGGAGKSKDTVKLIARGGGGIEKFFSHRVVLGLIS